MEKKKITKAPLAKEQEYIITHPPYTVFGSDVIPESFTLTMKARGLREMLDKFDLDGEDTFRIEVFPGDRATEYSFIKHKP